MVRYQAEFYTGRIIGNSFMFRVGYQVVAYDANTNKRKYAFGNSPCHKLGWVASHPYSGPNKRDRERLDKMSQEASFLAAKWNAERKFDNGLGRGKK